MMGAGSKRMGGGGAKPGMIKTPMAGKPPGGPPMGGGIGAGPPGGGALGAPPPHPMPKPPMGGGAGMAPPMPGGSAPPPPGIGSGIGGGAGFAQGGVAGGAISEPPPATPAYRKGGSVGGDTKSRHNSPGRYRCQGPRIRAEDRGDGKSEAGSINAELEGASA